MAAKEAPTSFFGKYVSFTSHQFVFTRYEVVTKMKIRKLQVKYEKELIDARALINKFTLTAAQRYAQKN